MLVKIAYKEHIHIGRHELFQKREVPPGYVLYFVNNKLVKILF